MFKKIEGASVIELHGLTMNIPSLGYGISESGDVKSVEVFKRSNVDSEQYWEVDALPDNWEDLRYQEKQKQEIDEDYFDPILEEIRAKWWHRRIYGVWFYNNGNEIYLTGLHWFYLTCWQLDTGLPLFRMIDLEVFYMWMYCVEDPDSFGLLYTCKRRNGKTAISSCMIYECISRSTRALGGMQSKTLEDAAEIFDYHIVPAFQQLPDFFIPIYDKSRGSTPKKELLFQLTSVKGRDSSANFRAKQLRSVIDYKESNPKAYDGKRLKRYVGDERGKVEFDVIQAHIMIRKCLVDIQRRIIGKMLITTTVEELGIKYRYDELWKWSDQRKRQEDGRTKSGLYKLFIPADRSGEFNVYGEPHILKNRKSILEERERLRDSPRDLIAEIRKEPLTEEEAFKVSNNECHFNQLLLEDAYSNITAIEKEVMCYGNLIWKDNQMMSDVEWKDGDRDSKFKVPKAFLTHWLETRKFDDIIEKRGNIFIPKNYIRFTSAIDPFANNITVDSINSKAASYVYNRHDNSVMSKTFDKSFIWQYHARPNTTSLQNEDMIKQCFFFGCQLLIENNREGGIRNDFKNFGCEAFMMKLDQYPDYGIPSSESNKSLGVNLLEQHIEREGRDNKIYFSELIYDLIRFNVNETEKSNLSMAAMWTLVASYYKQYNIKTDTKAIQIGDFFKKKKIV